MQAGKERMHTIVRLEDWMAGVLGMREQIYLPRTE